MPGWNGLYETMVNHLYPANVCAEGISGREAMPLAHRDWLLRQVGATSAYLRIAEEFEAQFGRPALDQMILHHVPDRQFEPGRLHHMLLQLPWADVMTTNWDTLLERTAEVTEERVYDVVRTVEEISEARAPRIVKLHGSFPSHRPFVFTEEDFRKYPADSAAFLNLAQQLAMENTLVLLGFSGDDPNFLFWSGWVRDRLGQNAPLIYLVGALGLSAPKRKMLESRRVQPVDLSQLPQFAGWPEPRRIELANQWFLERLRVAEPYQAHRWPRPPAGFVPPLELVAPPIDPRAPLPNPDQAVRGASVETLRGLVLQWRQNRSLYPGWVVPPLDTTGLLWHRIDDSISDVLRGLRELEPDERLDALYELNWQLEAALVPLVLTIDDLVSDTLDDAAARYGSLSQERASHVRALVLALVRHAREERAADTFHRWNDWLEQRIQDDPRLLDRLTYERILWARSELDMEAAEALVAGWTVRGDSFWLLRKAGMLADLGREEEAADMSAEALATIRAQTLRGGTDIASWSRESFALLFRSAVLFGEFGRWMENKPITDRFDLRQDVLQARGCPGKHDFFMLIERLGQAPPPPRQRLVITRRFDLGSTNATHHLARIDARLDRLTAYQALRFQEETGLPVRIGHASLSGQLLIEAARWLMDVAPTRAIDALLRASPQASDKLFDKLLTRATVARTSPAKADELIERLIRMMTSARGRVSARNSDADFWRDRLKFGLEIASRFVVIAPERAVQLLEFGLSLLIEERDFDRSEYDGQLADIVRRTLEAASDESLDAMLLAVFRTPIPVEPAANAPPAWDPAAGLSSAHKPGEANHEWKAVVADTIHALRERPTRWAASARLQWLLNVGAIGEEDRGLVGVALWADAFVVGGLPIGTIFYPATFLDLPKPEGCDPAHAIRMLLLGLEPLTDADIMDGALSHALAQSSLELAAKDIDCQIERMTRYVGDHPPEPGHPDILGHNRSRLVEGTSSIAASLARRSAPDPALHSSIGALFALDRYPLRREPATPWLMRIGLLDSDEATIMMRRLFTSKERGDVLVAQHLLEQICDQQPIEGGFEKVLWAEIGSALAASRSTSVPVMLRFCVTVVRNDPQRLPAITESALDICLRRILEDTEQAQPSEDLAYDPYLARRFAAALVKLLREVGRIESQLGEAWSAAVENDPLPDTRRV
ncbi:SIR2 family protein [Sphingomonas sp. R86521]|uniref:SIR2 family protein n=1 Tax=Sphingomonas sp. R86521 TaxID=3093860 RepID=UPI0036D30BFA